MNGARCSSTKRVLDRDVLGFRGAQAPESAPSQKQRAKRLDALRAACQHYVRDTLLPELDRALGGSPLDRDRWRLVMDPDDVDAQTISPIRRWPHPVTTSGPS